MNEKLKLFGILALITVGLLTLVGCSPSKMTYDGKVRPVSEVEEIISDKLEVENPGLDLEVNIYEDSDDNKKKRKSKH